MLIPDNIPFNHINHEQCLYDFDTFRKFVLAAPTFNSDIAYVVQQRNRSLTKPLGSLGRLEDIAVWLAAWQGHSMPSVSSPLVAIFAANHGIAGKEVSAYPQTVTRQMVDNFLAGGAAINQVCHANNIALEIFALDLDNPTPDISEQDAFSERDCCIAIQNGINAVLQLQYKPDLLALGEMGIANTTVASCIYHALLGDAPESWVGIGTGINSATLARKTKIVAKAVSRLGVDKHDSLTILRCLGGREIAAIVGAIVCARHCNIPVVIDGFVCTAAAMILFALDHKSIDHCQFAHVSAESAHRAVLTHMGARPILDLEMRLGEGTGAALAINIIRTSAFIHAGMATFEDAGVSRAT